ncbi:MAG: Pr6Pr family membrane protein [Sphingobacterium sp.]
MTSKELPKNIKWINAIILIAMAIITVDAIKPWVSWKIDPSADAYGWNRFSFFTVQSNFIAAGTYLLAAISIITNTQLRGWFRYLRGGAVLYMMVTGIVYTVLLRDTGVNPNPGHFDWSNFILHQFGPFFIVIWWLLWPSRLAVSSVESLRWLIFPFLWLIYTFVRASFTGWFPYPFLNPDMVGGAYGVSLYVVGITIFILLLSQLLAWISRARANNHTLY